MVRRFYLPTEWRVDTEAAFVGVYYSSTGSTLFLCPSNFCREIRPRHVLVKELPHRHSFYPLILISSLFPLDLPGVSLPLMTVLSHSNDRKLDHLLAGPG